jgi:hypothetical protein
MDVIVAPLLAGLFATFVGVYDVKHTEDVCKPPAIRVESANLAELPGPNSPACLAARKAAEEKKKNEEKPTGEKKQ